MNLRNDRRRWPWLAVVVVVAAAAAWALFPSVGSARGTTILHFREPTTNGSSINAAGKVNRQGDYLVWDDPLKDASTGKSVGRVAGLCMLVDAKTQVYDCGPVTYILSGGTIYSEGLLYGNGKSVPGPIVGGTGKYEGVHGHVVVSAISPAITDHVLTITG